MESIRLELEHAGQHLKVIGEKFVDLAVHPHAPQPLREASASLVAMFEHQQAAVSALVDKYEQVLKHLMGA